MNEDSIEIGIVCYSCKQLRKNCLPGSTGFNCLAFGYQISDKERLTFQKPCKDRK